MRRRSGRLSGAGVVCWSRHGRSWRVPDAGLNSSSLCAIFSIYVVVSDMTFFCFAVFFALLHCATRCMDERNFALFPPSSGLMF